MGEGRWGVNYDRAARKVRRVLVMLDYGDDDPASGEVFDVTALVSEMVSPESFSASLELKVRASNYRSDEGVPIEIIYIETLSHRRDAIENLSWLIPLALDSATDDRPSFAEVVYP